VTSSLHASLQRRLLRAPFDPAQFDREQLRAHLMELLRDEEPLAHGDAADRLLDELVDHVGGLGPLEPWLNDPSITEIMVNGPDRVYIERDGQLSRVPCTLDAATITRLVERVIGPLGLRLDRASPIVDARLADGSRLHAVLPPLAPDGPCVTIRRFVARGVGLDAFGLDDRGASLLSSLVRSGANLLVSGGTSAGKTTLCNALAREIDSNERIVTVEETAELQLGQPHVVRLEARPANAEGAGAVSVRDLVRTALRMRPDRLIVGEVRGGEALDMLQACNTGHDGSLSTLHANNARDALTRLETLTLYSGVPLPLAAIRAQIGAAIDVVAHVARRSDGRRAVRELVEVDPRGRSVHAINGQLRRPPRRMSCAQ
jgi:pilus assembly protein CpaF